MRTIRELDPIEIRVLGALLEKEQATPDYYPLTVNALLGACNQKSNREPVTELTETDVVEALDRLFVDVLAWRSEGARAERWSQSISRRLELDPAARALLTLLMLRGPQTPGQLRARSGRLHAFSDLGEVEATLREMAGREDPLVVELERRPGTKERRWAHLLGGWVEEVATESGARPAGGSEPAGAPEPVGARDVPVSTAPGAPGLGERLAALERRVDELARELERLRDELGS